MSFYTAKEVQTINRAWYTLCTYVEHRSGVRRDSLDNMVKMERGSAGGNLAEARYFVLNEIRNGYSCHNTPIQPYEVAQMRPSLILAWMFGVELYGRYNKTDETKLGAIWNFVRAAKEMHANARERFQKHPNAA